MSKSHKIKLAVLVILFFTAVFSIYFCFREDRKGILKVAFLDIGQGDAIYIESPNGNQMLIDGGPNRAVLRELSKVMPFYDRSLDVVLATHADSDHVGGLPDVLDKYRVDLFLETGVPGESLVYEELEALVASRETLGKTKKILVKRGMVVDLGGGAILQILFPDRDPSGMETNTSSIVARLVYGENEFLFTGDSPQSIENYLVGLGGLQSDVLKAGHHGSKTSTGPAFVTAVSPQYTVISAGKDNRYGHPNQEVLNTLTNFGVQTLRTDLSGRIVFKSDGVNLNVK